MVDLIYKILDSTLKIMKKYILYIILLFCYIYFDYIYLFLKIDLSNITKLQYILMILIRSLVFTIFFIIKDRKYLKEKLIDFKNNYKNYVPYSYKMYLKTLFLMIIIGIIISKYVTTGVNEETVEDLLLSYPHLMIFSTIIFAPFCEEMLFRREIGKLTKNKYLYLILNFLLFGILHVQVVNNPYEYLLIIQYGLFGWGFAKIVKDTDNIYCSMLVHATHNLATTILLLVSGGLL